MDYSAINRNHARAQQRRADDRIQDEIVAAKEIQRETACSWTEALKMAHDLLARTN
jgi:hypothetical protein